MFWRLGLGVGNEKGDFPHDTQDSSKVFFLHLVWSFDDLYGISLFIKSCRCETGPTHRPQSAVLHFSFASGWPDAICDGKAVLMAVMAVNRGCPVLLIGKGWGASQFRQASIRVGAAVFPVACSSGELQARQSCPWTFAGLEGVGTLTATPLRRSLM